MCRITTLWQIVLFLFICRTGSGCNSGWLPFRGICYKVIDRIASNVRQASRFCVLAGGQLAFIDSDEILKFFHTMPNFNETNEYWVNRFSTLEYRTTTISRVETSEDAEYDQSCPYAKLIDLHLEYCTEKKFFICETKDQNPSEFCPTGFDYYGTHCYRIITFPKNYTIAQGFCLLQQAKLAILDSESKEWEAKNMVIGRNETFFIGASKDENGVFKWANGNDFDTVLRTFLTDTDERCLGIRSSDEEPTLIGWVQVDCAEEFAFICEATPIATSINSTEELSTVQQHTDNAIGLITTTMPSSTSELPLVCPHGYNWKSHEASGYCYWETTYEAERLNWYQARNFCKLYGGDLASYESEEQQNIGLGGAYGHYRGLWIGLKRDENDVFHWTDGTELTYTNWNYHEPNLRSKSKFCVIHASGNSKWELDYCGVRRWFICKAPKVNVTLIPNILQEKQTRCNVGGVSAYRNDWFLYEDHCYLVHAKAKYSWDTARIFCQDNGAHLASIESFEETDFILSVSFIYSETDYWIGLNSRGLHSSFTWSDGTPLNFNYWSDGESSDNSEKGNSCVKFSKRDGSWTTDHCNRLQGIICKRGINSTYDFTTTEPTTVMPGSCEKGWYNLGNKCYSLFGKLWTKRLQWEEAKAGCERIGASLVSIHSQDEQDFLSDIVLEAATDVWIGLKSRDGGSIFHWSDDSNMDYANWNENQPEYSDDTSRYDSFSTNMCVRMEYDKINIGKWDDVDCSERRAYICEKMKNPLLTEPYENPFKCSNISGWYKLASSCYGFFDQEKLPWLAAQRECRKYEANLVTFTSSAVQIFLTRKVNGKNAYYWIGAREKMKNTYEFITGQEMFFTNWTSGQPRAASQLFDNCVSMTSSGSWVVKSCEEQHPYICRISQEVQPEQEIPSGSTCENVGGDWLHFGSDNCYLIIDDRKKTWKAAMHYCFKHGGYLASFHSANDIEELVNRIKSESTYFHIGLGRKRDGSYAWVDNSPVDFTAWDEDGEPEDNSNECVALSSTTGKWRAVDCDNIYTEFICSAPKLQIDDKPLTKNYSLEQETIRQKLTIGGIFGIVICVLVVMTIIGVTLYYLRPVKQVQPKLLDSEPL